METILTRGSAVLSFLSKERRIQGILYSPSMTRRITVETPYNSITVSVLSTNDTTSTTSASRRYQTTKTSPQDGSVHHDRSEPLEQNTIEESAYPATSDVRPSGSFVDDGEMGSDRSRSVSPSESEGADDGFARQFPRFRRLEDGVWQQQGQPDSLHESLLSLKIARWDVRIWTEDIVRWGVYGLKFWEDSEGTVLHIERCVCCTEVKERYIRTMLEAEKAFLLGQSIVEGS